MDLLSKRQIVLVYFLRDSPAPCRFCSYFAGCLLHGCQGGSFPLQNLKFHLLKKFVLEKYTFLVEFDYIFFSALNRFYINFKRPTCRLSLLKLDFFNLFLDSAESHCSALVIGFSPTIHLRRNPTPIFASQCTW